MYSTSDNINCQHGTSIRNTFGTASQRWLICEAVSNAASLVKMILSWLCKVKRLAAENNPIEVIICPDSKTLSKRRVLENHFKYHFASEFRWRIISREALHNRSKLHFQEFENIGTGISP